MTAVAFDNSFYKEHQGVDYLSRNFQSSLLLSPSDVRRRTISQENFSRQRARDSRELKTPWGRRYSYGGLGPLNLPDEHRPKSEPPIRVQKGHRHFTAGACVHPRYVATDGKYQLTSIQRSNVRATDELIEAPTKVDVAKHAINLNFPAEHPFATHIERADVFPPYDIPPNQVATSPADIPVAAPDILIHSKAKGAAYRYEKTSMPADRERKPIEWHEGPNFFQRLKSDKKQSQVYYPTPLKSLDPNYKVNRCVSPQTVSALTQLRKIQWTSTYRRDIDRETNFISNCIQSVNSRDKACTEQMQCDEPTDAYDGKTLAIHKSSIETARNNASKSVRFQDQVGTTDIPDEPKVAYSSDEEMEHVKHISPERELSPATALSPSSGGLGQTFRDSSSKAFMMASYPPDRSRQSRLTTECTKNENENPRCYSEELTRGWSRSDIRRNFNRTHNDVVPDLRRKPDLRITTNERRHRFPEFGDAGSYVWNGQSIPYLKGTVNEQ